MITDKEFIKEENEEEIKSVIESFLNRLRDWGYYDKTGELFNGDLKELIITDKEKSRIIKQMIKDFKEYKK